MGVPPLSEVCIAAALPNAVVALFVATPTLSALATTTGRGDWAKPRFEQVGDPSWQWAAGRASLWSRGHARAGSNGPAVRAPRVHVATGN